MLAFAGGLYSVIEMLDFFGMYTKDQYSKYAFFVILIASILANLVTRRPVSKVSYKVPKKDLTYEVIIGDIMDSVAPNIIISTNTTFDTDMSSRLIAQDSLQGQMSLRFFQGNTKEVDRQIDTALNGITYVDHPTGVGKKQKYEIGTIAKIESHGKYFFMTAMAELNAQGTASSSGQMVETALDKLWEYIIQNAELGDIAMPIMGTGRGRIPISRKKMVEKIAQSFADASTQGVFSNKLIIYIHPSDASKHNVNLFEIRDYLSQSLQV